MHELGIANAVLEAVKAEAARHDGAIPVKVGVRLGELAGIDQDALRFSFEAIVRGTDLENLQLEIELCPRRHRCSDCGGTFVVRDYDTQCPGCLSAATECIGGTELELAYVEVEDSEPSVAGTQST